jgi:hypothetical protein
MDKTKEEYLKWVVGYFGKKYDERFFGVIESLKFQDGMVVHSDVWREVKSDPIPRFSRKEV